MPRKKITTTTGAQTTGAKPTGGKLERLAETVATSEPMMTSLAVEGPSDGFAMRRNIAGSIERTSRYANIDEGLVPYRYSSTTYGYNRSSIDVRDAVVLCQKAYYNFAIFRNIIDLMTEFSCGEIVLKGGNAKTRGFFKGWMKKINFWNFEDMFYREYYRSGNVFIYRFDADIRPSEVRTISEMFSEANAVAIEDAFQAAVAKEDPKNTTYLAPNLVNIHPEKLIIEKNKIPARYLILNPADIQMMSTLNFAYGIYFKILTDYEIAMLRNPQTERDIAVFNDLPKEVQKQIKAGSRVIAIPLDPRKVSMVFYKKQDYEPFAVPMGFPVLEDINFKAELRKIDMAICRTMQQIILVVTTGTEPDKGGVNPKYIMALQKLFQNQSVGRVLIADYTTKAQWAIPEIGDLLDPKKYEIVNQDINIGLNNIFVGSDKFANQAQKVELFISRLKQGRRAFINSWLNIEMERIGKSLNFKNIPTAEYEDIELKDEATMQKIYARLIEIGVLTPEEGFRALKTGILPDPETMEDNQKEYKKQRDAGMYVPLVGGPKDGQGGDAGNPGGPTGGQTTKKVSPIGTKASIEEPKVKEAEMKFSTVGVRDNLLLSCALDKEVQDTIKAKEKIKKLTKLQKIVANDIATLIMSNEEPSKWMESVKKYCDNPEDTNPQRVLEVNKIATTHQLDSFLASILLASKVENG